MCAFSRTDHGPVGSCADRLASGRQFRNLNLTTGVLNGS
jgi:hypothetical protein